MNDDEPFQEYLTPQMPLVGQEMPIDESKLAVDKPEYANLTARIVHDMEESEK